MTQCDVVVAKATENAAKERDTAQTL